MRVYFEKPRTTVGWKGLINDPYLDESYRIHEGLRIARQLLLDINRLGVPAGRRVPRHDLAAVHRRPDQLGRDRRAHHREPGAPRAGVGPVGAGRLQERHRRQPQDRDRRDPGRRRVRTISCRCTRTARSPSSRPRGNKDCHVILRGGKAPNYDAASVDAACAELEAAKLAVQADDRLQPRQQREEVRAPGRRSRATSATSWPSGNGCIFGVMVESHLHRRRAEVHAGQGRSGQARIRQEHHRRLHRLGRLADVLDMLRDAVLARRRQGRPGHLRGASAVAEPRARCADPATARRMTAAAPGSRSAISS